MMLHTKFSEEHCVFNANTGDDPSNHPALPKLPPHLGEHERDPLSLNPEVFFHSF